MKYIILSIFILLFSGCDFKKVDEGNTPPPSAMKCGAGKCGASMMETNSSAAPVMKCAPGKCGAAMNAPTQKNDSRCGAAKIDTH